MYYKVITISFLFFLTCQNIQSQAVQQWLETYNGTANGSDQAISVVIDDSGFIYVSGNSAGAGTLADIVTIKYDPASGDTIWVKRYSGPSSDQVNAIAYGKNAIYVTGWSIDPGRDIITIKYDAATGAQLWAKKYNGPGNGGDYGIAIAVDSDGNAYVCGRAADIGNVQHFVVLKYNAATGSIMTGFPVVYNGALATAADEAHSIIVDNSGSIYVTGKTLFNTSASNILTFKLSSSGSLIWARLYAGPSEDNGLIIKLNSTQTGLFVGGWGYRPGLQDFLVLKYAASNGDSLAFASYNGPANSIDMLSSMAIDDNDNLDVTGISLNTSVNKYEVVTIQYNSNLVQQWLTRYSGPQNGWDISSSIAVDLFGNVYICGRSVGSSLNDDFLTIMYNSSGTEKWVQKYNGPGNGADAASSIVVDGYGNLFVTGSSTVNGAYDFATIKYGSSFTAIENISLLLYRIDQLVASGILKENQANVLVIQLERARDKILQGQFKSAKTHIDVFLLEVGILVRRGILSSGQAEPLIAIANSIIEQLEEMGTGPLTLNSNTGMPGKYELYDNFPNPFNPATKISFNIPFKSETQVSIYDVNGREVDVLMHQLIGPGHYEVVWDASGLSSGIYFYNIVSGSYSMTKKMVLIK